MKGLGGVRFKKYVAGIKWKCVITLDVVFCLNGTQNLIVTVNNPLCNFLSHINFNKNFTKQKNYLKYLIVYKIQNIYTQGVSAQRLQSFLKDRVHLDDGESNINARLEIISWLSSHAKNKRKEGHEYGEKTF